MKHLKGRVLLCFIIILIISSIKLPLHTFANEGDAVGDRDIAGERGAAGEEPASKNDSPVKVVQGKVDLTNKLLDEEGPIKLHGEWEFYWQELLTPEDFIRYKSGLVQSSDSSVFSSPDLVSIPTPTLVKVPDTWSNYTIEGEALPKYGYATYRLTMRLHEADVGQLVAFYLPNVATAYRLWVDNELLLSNGIVAKTRQEMIPQNYAKIVIFEATYSELEILVQVSDFYQRKAGLWDTIRFGTAEQITQLRERNTLFQMFVVGSIFIIGFYQLVLFLYRPREYTPLYLAIACFSIALRTLLLKDALLVYYFSALTWEIAVKLEYLAALLAILCFLLFVRQELAQDLPRRMIRFFVILVLGYSLFVLFTPALIFTNTFLFLQVLVVVIMFSIVLVTILALRRKREGAYLRLIALLGLFMAILNDFFYYSQVITTDEFVSLGLLFYLFIQSVHLARRFSRSFEHIEKLSLELQELNQSLERKVEKRTQELRAVNKSLQKMEQARRRLLASVSHELNTPLTFIQGYIKAMMDGVISKDDSTYLRAVYNDTQMMAHMIRDLQVLSKLESGQVTFQYERIDIRTFLRQIYEEQKQIIEEKGLYLEYTEKLNSLKQEDQVICIIDPVRIKQAYLNLIINAQKFTPSEGTITVELEMFPTSFKEVRVNVKDTGLGIGEKDLPYIFERFYKANQQGGHEQRGAGLGLAIAKEIVEYHQGYVGVDSEEGKGSVFFFTLPIHTIRRGSWKGGKTNHEKG